MFTDSFMRIYLFSAMTVACLTLFQCYSALNRLHEPKRYDMTTEHYDRLLLIQEMSKRIVNIRKPVNNDDDVQSDVSSWLQHVVPLALGATFVFLRFVGAVRF